MNAVATNAGVLGYLISTRFGTNFTLARDWSPAYGRSMEQDGVTVTSVPDSPEWRRLIAERWPQLADELL